jgi:hypothetical protein
LAQPNALAHPMQRGAMDMGPAAAAVNSSQRPPSSWTCIKIIVTIEFCCHQNIISIEVSRH